MGNKTGDSAFPEVTTDFDREYDNDQEKYVYYPNTYSCGGLSKREMFAAMALQGLLANPAMGTPPANNGVLEVLAVEAADALIAELDKPQRKEETK